MTLTAMDVEQFVWEFATDSDEVDQVLRAFMEEIRAAFAELPDESESL
jgi:hypothetical protein